METNSKAEIFELLKLELAVEQEKMEEVEWSLLSRTSSLFDV
jgi:hypothetical protein